MLSTTRLVCSALVMVWCSVQAPSLFGQDPIVPVLPRQDPILPHGDPLLQSSQEERTQQEDTRRDRRLKQPEPSSGDSSGLAPQDTGISDPSVNPGQAAGMKTVHGRIIESQTDRHVLHQRNGSDMTLVVDAETTGDTDLRPGDIVTGIITPQGRVVAIHKNSSPEER